MAGTNEFAPQMKIEKQVPDGLGKILNSRLVGLPDIEDRGHFTSQLALPAQPVDATPSSQLI